MMKHVTHITSALFGFVFMAHVANAQKLDEGLFEQGSSSSWDMRSSIEQLMADLDANRNSQMGFQVSFQFSWMVAPEGFAYEDGLNIITRTSRLLYPGWSESQANDFSQTMSNTGLWNRFADENRAARPWSFRFAWVDETTLPLSLSFGVGQMGLDYYIEAQDVEGSAIGLNAHQVRATTFISDFHRLKEEFGNPWWFPQDPRTPDALAAWYLEGGVGKRIHPLASLFVHYRLPIGVADAVRKDLNAENTAFDEPRVTISDAAEAHFGPVVSVQAQYHGRFMEWGIERVMQIAPSGSWPEYLIENGAIPFQSRSHTEVSVGIRF
jgi:hypothetical protein